MSSWTSVLQQIVELDPDDFDPGAFSDEQLRETMPITQVGINRLAAVLTQCVAVGEARQVHRADGMGSMKAWLTGQLRLSATEAAGYVRASRRLAQLPELAAAYAEARSLLHTCRWSRRPPGSPRQSTPASTWRPPTGSSPKRRARGAPRTPAGRSAGGWQAWIPTDYWMTPPVCRGSGGWPRAAVVGCTSPSIWTRWAARPCTPHCKP
jgi:hypothetical protein